jgi:hypothetical protein
VVLDGVDHLAAGTFLLERCHRVLEIEEHHVDRQAGRLLDEPRVGARDGVTGTAGKLSGAL